MPLETLAKKLVFSLLPEPLLRPLRKARALSVLRDFTEAEEPDLRVVKHLVQPGDTVVDVGANIGYYTHFLSERVGPQGTVHGVEPIPTTFEILQAGVERFGLSNVRLHNCALSEASGTAEMSVPPYDSGGLNFYQARITQDGSSDASSTFTVPLHTLDEILEGSGDAVSFIKVDVEGAELACLRGAQHTIERSGAAWLIEVSGNPDEPDSQARALFERLEGAGYTAHWFDGERLRPRAAGDVSVNYFFLTEAQASALGSYGSFE